MTADMYRLGDLRVVKRTFGDGRVVFVTQEYGVDARNQLAWLDLRKFDVQSAAFRWVEETRVRRLADSFTDEVLS